VLAAATTIVIAIPGIFAIEADDANDGLGN
jgi:hypothetical protein